MDNKVLESMNTMIKDKYNVELDLVPPGCYWRNGAEVVIINFKAHCVGILAVLQIVWL